MNRTSLSRRLLASVAGLAIGLGGALALAGPAQAEVIVVPPIDTSFFDTCAGTYVELPSTEGVAWSVTAGDDTFYPSESADIQDVLGLSLVFVPAGAGEIEVGFDDHGEGWPKKHTWSQPEGCEDLPAPTHTQPTCDTAGEIVIPDLPTPEELSRLLPEEYAWVVELLADVLVYRLNGEVVEPGSTHTVEPGTYVVTLTIEHAAVFSEQTVEVNFLLKSWTIEIEAPECPLPDTGTQVALIAAGALVLLTAGGALYLVARRRRISFTA